MRKGCVASKGKSRCKFLWKHSLQPVTMLDPHQPPLMLFLHSPKPTYPLKFSQSLFFFKPCELESHNFQLKILPLLVINTNYVLSQSPCVSSSVCCCSVAKSCLTLWDPMDAAHQDSLSFTVSWSLLKLMSIELVMPSNHLILCIPLLLLPSIFPSIRVVSSESALCIQWPKYRSFSFSTSPSSEYSGLISLRTDWFDLLAVQGTLKNLLQQQLELVQKHQFFSAQLSLWSNSHIHTWILEKP